MKARLVRIAYGVLITVLILGTLLAAAYWLSVERQAAATSRDVTRTSDLLRWRQVLVDYRAAGQAFPTPEQREQVFKERERQGAPKPPADGPAGGRSNDPHYRYAADPAGAFYAMCAILERDNSAEAYFVTANGSFTAKGEHCNAQLAVRTANFITATSMTTEAANLFLEIPTAVEGKDRIREVCAGTRDTQTAVYGCFNSAGPNGKISVLEITDPELGSQTEVVAAHELLHAAYQKLTDEERAQLNQQLATQAAQPGYETLAEELSLYTADERAGELHSRLATEYAQLSPELEAYYRRYFRTRGPLVAKHEPYRALLAGLRNLERRLQQSRARLDALLANGQDDAYNNGVGPYNRLVNEYNATATRYNLLTR